MAKATHADIIKKQLIQALTDSLGIVTDACKAVKIARSTFYKYYKADAKFKKEVDDIGEVAIDFVEGILFKNIKKGDTTSVIFYLKTKGKKRGYIEKSVVEHEGNIAINISPNEKGV